MPEVFDMGKYGFYVWSSVAVFFFLIALDIYNLWRKEKQLCRQLSSFQRRRQQATSQRNRSEP